MQIVVHEDDIAPKFRRFYAIDSDTFHWVYPQRMPGSIGFGPTPDEAIADLLETMLDEGEITENEFHGAMESKQHIRAPKPPDLRN